MGFLAGRPEVRNSSGHNFTNKVLGFESQSRSTRRKRGKQTGDREGTISRRDFVIRAFMMVRVWAAASCRAKPCSGSAYDKDVALDYKS